MNRPWDDASDDELLGLLGTALAPNERTEVDGAPALTIVGGAATARPPHRSWRALAAVAAAVLVVVGASVALDRPSGGDDVVTPTSAQPSDLAAASLDRLERALAGPDDALVADALEAAQDALDRLTDDERRPLALRATALLTEAAARLGAAGSTTSSTSTTATTVPGTDPGTGTSTPGTGSTTPTTDDHGGDDTSGSGSGSSGSGSSGSGSSGSGSSGSGSSGSGSDDSGSGGSGSGSDDSGSGSSGSGSSGSGSSGSGSSGSGGSGSGSDDALPGSTDD